MDKRKRCDVRNEFGQRCNQPVHHRRKLKTPHSAFGHEWVPATPKPKEGK